MYCRQPTVLFGFIGRGAFAPHYQQLAAWFCYIDKNTRILAHLQRKLIPELQFNAVQKQFNSNCYEGKKK